MALNLLINHQTLGNLQDSAEFEDYLYDSGIHYDEDADEYMCDGDSVDIRHIANEYLRDSRCFHEKVSVHVVNGVTGLMCFSCVKSFPNLEAFENDITAPVKHVEHVQVPQQDYIVATNAAFGSPTEIIFHSDNVQSFDYTFGKSSYTSSNISEEMLGELKSKYIKSKKTEDEMMLSAYFKKKEKENKNDNKKI